MNWLHDIGKNIYSFFEFLVLDENNDIIVIFHTLFYLEASFHVRRLKFGQNEQRGVLNVLEFSRIFSFTPGRAMARNMKMTRNDEKSRDLLTG